ncbi:hypothetical protein [Aquimarina litoralis]|uniref:hypothetical protein n=1 Tax=Aquimarina litoralis TaxID=584605 RepID=UPI001C5A21B4|nr:hypothetical protein [Aquimarina litoralis]MBW1296017.1 hypothetical protein [Aquimarina litoralis]
MKLKLFLLLLFLTTLCTNAQTDCSLDETKLTGIFTTAEVGGTKIKASDATSNYRFGERVAIDGNIAAVASRSNAEAAGKVYIFTNDGSGNWTQQTIITASDSFSGDNFGSEVALEGNYLVVGARSQLDKNDVDTGAAYLFEYNGVSTWTEVARFEPSDGGTDNRFGTSVDIEGDLILVGARKGCTGGCAYLYENDGTGTFTYTETKLEPQVQSGYDGARFGETVVLKDGRAYVGGPYDYSSVGRFSAGSVQIWDQANDGTWSRTHRLRGTESSESFGWEMDVEGDYLAIGAMNFEVSSTPEADQGRVYVYKADSNGDYLEANRVMIQNDDKDSFTDQRFGSAVALEDGFLYVGTWGSGNANGDSVYIFKDDGTNNWTQITKLTTGSGWDEFSNRAVAVSYPNLLIGQNEDDSPSNSGAVHFVPLASTETPVASVTDVSEVFIGQSNGSITVSFDDEATRTQIAFSVDGGVTYPYVFNDDAGTGVITNLSQGSFSLKAKFEGGSCILDLGTVDVNQAPYTSIPDANFEARLEALGYDDISGDGQVPTPLIEGVTDLQLAGQGITDLTGIQDFTVLEELKANGNNLTDVDLSSNIALRLFWATSGSSIISIDVTNNPLLEDLRLQQHSGTSIDISNLPALDRFQCTDCSLTSLDTSGNPSLSWLDLENTSVASLYLGLNTNLEILEIDNTSLTSLDLSDNIGLTHLYAENITNLIGLNIQNGANTNIVRFETVGTPVSCVKVDDAAYSTTNWTGVEPVTTFQDSGYCLYTQIPDANFEAELEALGYDDISSDGQVPTSLIEIVTSLDVSNKSIADLTGIEDFKALQILKCQSNNLTVLNISNNTTLIELTANANNINSIDLSQNIVLETLIIGANDLTSIDISNNNLLKRLDILYNDITVLDTSNNPDLVTLKAYNTDVVSYDFSNNPLLQNVQLYNNSSLTSLDVSNLTQLDQLRLDNTGITDLDLSNNPNLRIIRVNQSNINKLDLSNQSSLIHVYVDNSPINFLNVQNGNNTNFTQFHADNTPNLYCVVVDDAAYSTTNWTNIDGTMSFSDTYCNYTAIPDANFEAALYTLGYDDIANDGQVPTALVEPVTTLDVSNQNIADLTGIEDFEALTDLNLDTNVLTSLDLSNNTNLQTLNFDNNSIANLNLGTISNLTSIEGRYNQLTTIDVSQNSDLTFINLRDNLFTTVDVSNNPLLETINLRGCTNLTSIDISGNPNVKFLYFQDTALTGLDVSQNLLLEVIVIERVNFNTIDVSNLSNLRQLRIADNSFTHLDVSNNPALVRLECENNDLTYLNLKNGNNINMPNTDFIATGNPSLSCIIVDDATWSSANWTNIDGTASFNNTFCRYTAIPDANFEAELEALGYDDISGDRQVPTPLIEVLSSLDVDGKNINDLTGIEDFVALTYLNCNGNNLTTIDITKNIQLTYFNAAQNNISTVDLSNNTLLETLYLFSNDLSAIDLSNNTALKQLYIQRNTNLPNFDISNNILLEEIDCSETNITTLNTKNNTLLRNLEANDSPLSSLDLSTNTALELLRLFTTNITVLDLTNNINLTELRINDTGIQSLDLRNQVGLTTMNAKDANLSYLNMQNGNNTNVASYLFNVTNNPNLSCVLVDDAAWSTTNWTLIDATTSFSDTYCDYTSIPDSIFETRLEALGYDDISGDGQVPTALIEVVTSLTLNDLGINDATGIEDFAALVTLNARGNNFTTLDVSQNTLLEHLYINSNSLSSIDVSKNVLLRNLNIGSNAITSLDLSNNPDLRDLWVQGNKGLTSLDLSKNLELRELYTYSSGVSTLNLSIHTELRILSAYRTSIATIDLSNNTELRSLRVDETNLLSLDVTNNTKLESLRVNDTGITSLDLSNNPVFQGLHAHDASLTYLNVKNGNNINIGNFRIENNPNLSCVLVDDVDYSTNNWTDVDDTTDFSSTYCRYTAIPDANFEAELDALGLDDISGDGQVPTRLIEVAENLTIISKSIADITGIEDFKALKTLNCAGNTFTSLDLSNNTELTSVITKFTPITSLSISNCPNLDTLVCSFNDLTTLDISNNITLSYLECNNNNIANLDVTTNIALLDLRCGDNSLTTLDVSNNTLLTSIWCQNNNITELDFTNQTGLVSITVNNNSLTSLNVQNGNNTNVTNFIATGNTNLTCIYVDDATYSSTNWLGIDNTARFTDSYCRYTAIPDANFEAALEGFGYDDISNDGQVPTTLIENITTLNVTNLSIADFTGIEDFVGLTSLDAGNNSATSIDVTNLTLLEYLRLDAMSLTSIDLSKNIALVDLRLSYNAGISTLDLSNNTLLETAHIGNNSLTAIDLSKNVLLYELRMAGNDLTTLDLSSNTALKELNLSGNKLTSLNLKSGNNTTIENIHLRGNSLSCVLVDDASYSTIWWFDRDNETSFSDTHCGDIQVAIKVYLQGASINPNTGEESMMRDDLRISTMLPATSPYGDNATISDAVKLDDAGSDAMVDWVWIELRDANDVSIIVAQQSGILQRDGDIVATTDDRSTPLSFGVSPGNYYIVVKHRNHLSIMSSSVINLSSTPATVDFTSSTAIAGGANAVVDMSNGIVAMISGDFDENGQIQNSDINSVIQLLGGSGYHNADIDMNGQIQNIDINNLMNPNVGKGEQF